MSTSNRPRRTCAIIAGSIGCIAFLIGTVQSAAVIDTVFATPWNHTTHGGIDPNFIQHRKLNIAFHPIDANHTFPTASVNLTNGDAVIGIEIHHLRELQQMTGAGCGVTDAASIVLQDYKAKNPTEYKEIINLLFNQSPEWAIDKGGAGLNLLRSPLGATDFSYQTYSFDDTVDGSPDLNLSLFTIDKAPKMWATHKDVSAINPRVKRFFAPWSPPAWMKVNDTNPTPSMIGGQLQPKFFDAYARYLTKSMVAITRRLGQVPFQLSIQNEPGYSPPLYPGNIVAVPDAITIGEKVRRYLNAAGLGKITLTAYDHNWDTPDYPTQVFDGTKAFGSVSWHCYGGTPDQQAGFNVAFPGTPVFMTECTRITQNQEETWYNLRKSAIALLTGSVEQGTSGILLWNCALLTDQDGFTTPHLPETCSNCLAPILIPKGTVSTSDKSQGPPAQQQLTGRSSDLSERTAREYLHYDAYVPPGGAADTRGKYKITSDFVLLGHLTRAIRPRNNEEKWAVRVGATSSDQALGYPDGERVKVQAYRTSLGADGKRRWSVTLLQKHDRFLTGVYQDVTAVIKFKNQVANFTAPPGLYTLTWIE